MAVVSILFGGMVGFFSAAFGWIALDFSLLAALGLWGGVGGAAAVAIIVLALLPRQRPRERACVEHA